MTCSRRGPWAPSWDGLFDVGGARGAGDEVERARMPPGSRAAGPRRPPGAARCGRRRVRRGSGSGRKLRVVGSAARRSAPGCGPRRRRRSHAERHGVRRPGGAAGHRQARRPGQPCRSGCGAATRRAASSGRRGSRPPPGEFPRPRRPAPRCPPACSTLGPGSAPHCRPARRLRSPRVRGEALFDGGVGRPARGRRSRGQDGLARGAHRPLPWRRCHACRKVSPCARAGRAPRSRAAARAGCGGPRRRPRQPSQAMATGDHPIEARPCARKAQAASARRLRPGFRRCANSWRRCSRSRLGRGDGHGADASQAAAQGGGVGQRPPSCSPTMRGVSTAPMGPG